MVITHISSISKKAMSLFPISNVSLHANIAIRQRRARNQSSIKVTVLSAGKLTLLSISKPISLGKKMVPENLHALELVLKALPPTVTINFTSAPIATKVVKPAKIMASSVILRSAENALTSIQCFTLLIKNAWRSAVLATIRLTRRLVIFVRIHVRTALVTSSTAQDVILVRILRHFLSPRTRLEELPVSVVLVNLTAPQVTSWIWKRKMTLDATNVSLHAQLVKRRKITALAVMEEMSCIIHTKEIVIKSVQPLLHQIFPILSVWVAQRTAISVVLLEKPIVTSVRKDGCSKMDTAF